MDSRKNRSITPSDGGMINNFVNQIKLIVRLLADRRVSPWLKILPVGSLIYLVVPDIMPGPIDDAAAIWLATYLFVELCPPEVVEEHKNQIKKIEGKTEEKTIKEEDVVDAEFWEK